MLNLDSQYALPSGIQFRYEDFGGIVYSRSQDKLHFLNSSLAVDLLVQAGRGCVAEIVAKLGTVGSNQEVFGQHILKILHSLEELGIIYELI